jgi:hypothetical protein
MIERGSYRRRDRSDEAKDAYSRSDRTRDIARGIPAKMNRMLPKNNATTSFVNFIQNVTGLVLIDQDIFFGKNTIVLTFGTPKSTMEKNNLLIKINIAIDSNSQSVPLN